MYAVTTERPFRIGPARSGAFVRMACQVAERALGFPGINRIHTDACALPAECEFNQRVLNAMHVRSLVSDEDMRRIPLSGPLIVVANHPFGGLEGIILSALLRGVRNDVKLLANYLLGCIPEMRDSFIFVDPFGGSSAKLKNVAGMKEAIRWVREGRALGVFPSGEVSHLTWGRRCVTDPPWSESIARLVQQTGAAVLPIYFAGRNSAMFQVAGLIHPRLRTALLPREIAAKQSTSVEIHIGNVITPQRAAQFSNAADLTAFMRLRTYLLKGRAIGASAKTTKTFQFPQKTGKEKTIVAAQPQRLMVDEVGRLSADECLFASGDYQVFVTKAASIPTTLREIGRLRELTFRAVGEGTGREIDLDRFDKHYRHLFVWNKSREEIVGAYRLGLSDEILATMGIDGFYTRTLFRFDERLLRQIGPSLEAGRSFVAAAYQKSHSALSMLWKGVGRFAVANPRYRNIFGPVSISDRYHSMTKQLLMAFLGTADHRADLHALVRPTNPPRWGQIRDCDAEHLSTIVRSVEDVEELVGEIESDRRGMPVLLRQYLKLNAKLLGFNIDPDFGDVLDGLVLIDLSKVNRTILDYYMGRQGAAGFLKHHVISAAQ